MNSTQNLFEAVRRWCAQEISDATLIAIHRSALAEYKNTDLFQFGVERIRLNRSGVKDSADLFENTRVGMLEEETGFSSKLVLVNASLVGIGTLPSPSVVHAVDLPASFKLETYRIEGLTEIGDVPSVTGLTKIRTDVVHEGDVFLLKSGDNAYRINGLRNGSLLHRIDTPMCSPFTYNFDAETLEFLGLAFADHDGTRDDFFVQLVNAVVEHIAKGPETSDEAAAAQLSGMISFLERFSISEKVNVFSRWKAIQGLGLVKPGAATKSLEHMRANAGPNARARAAAVLERVAA